MRDLVHAGTFLLFSTITFTCKNIQGANDGLISTGLRVRQDVESAPMLLDLSSHPAPTHGCSRLSWGAEPMGVKGVHIPGGSLQLTTIVVGEFHTSIWRHSKPGWSLHGLHADHRPWPSHKLCSSSNHGRGVLCCLVWVDEAATAAVEQHVGVVSISQRLVPGSKCTSFFCVVRPNLIIFGVWGDWSAPSWTLLCQRLEGALTDPALVGGQKL